MPLARFGKNLWLYEGETVSFYGFPFPTRMTVIKLPDRRLWIHSPERLTPLLQAALSDLGEVSYLISPNKLHHLFLPEWIAAYPNALNYAAPGLEAKRKDIHFDHMLSEHAPQAWQGEIEQTLFRGSPVMQEVIFYHRQSKTLVLTDLIENFIPESLNGWQRRLAGIAGILAPNGKMPLDWRVSFSFGSKQQARDSLERILRWEIENIVLSHGACIVGNARAYLRESFAWLTDE